MTAMTRAQASYDAMEPATREWTDAEDDQINEAISAIEMIKSGLSDEQWMAVMEEVTP